MTSRRMLEVKKTDLAQARLATREDAPLKAGEIRARVDRFALTANNVTYGVFGERLGYWQFFPAEDGWGVIPVWGFADVVESRSPEIPVGDRLYGYFPMGESVVMAPAKVRPERMVDGSAHRAALPPVYNSYARTKAEPDFSSDMEDERMLLMPLFATSYCLYDFLADNQWFGAEQVIIASASSKTAIGLAMAIANDAAAPSVVGLTSSGNHGTVSRLKLYSAVHSYDDIDSIDAGAPTVIVDMSGDGALLSDLHFRLGDNMKHCVNVGATHYEDNRMGPHFIRERSAMFFAPGHIQKRAADWGPGELEKKTFAFWLGAATASRSFLKLERVSGAEALKSVYLRLLKGEVPPDRGIIVEMK